MEVQKTKKPPPLLIGDQSLKVFVNNASPFVDKTGMIRELISGSPGPYFISRPRRFGKTLLVNTLKNIFEGNRRLFDDLEIGKTMPADDWERFPVIKISFSGIDPSPALFEGKLISILADISKNNSLDVGPIDSVMDVSKIIAGMSERRPAWCPPDGLNTDDSEPMNVVLLIDEYDFPLIENIEDFQGVETIRKILHRFYSAIKASFEKLRFVFITGVTKFSQLSLFSAMNNIKDISLGGPYSAICGFTEGEIRHSFKDHLAYALSWFKEQGHFGQDATVDDLLNEIRNWYDGYTWDGRTKVYNPYSVMSFLNTLKHDYYWYKSGIPLLSSLLVQNDDEYFEMFSKSYAIGGTIPILDLNDIQAGAALFQTGYLTMETVDQPVEPSEYRLKCPNREVDYAIVHEFVNKKGVLPNKKETVNGKYGSFVDAFDASEETECGFLFSSCLAEIISHLHPRDEFVPHVMLHTLLNVKGQRSRMEVNLGEGRADQLYESPDGHIVVVELKHEKKSDRRSGGINDGDARGYGSGPTLPVIPEKPHHVRMGLEKCINEAFRQISEKKYALPLFGNARIILAAAVAVYGAADVRFSFKPVVWKEGKLVDPVP